MVAELVTRTFHRIDSEPSLNCRHSDCQHRRDKRDGCPRAAEMLVVDLSHPRHPRRLVVPLDPLDYALVHVLVRHKIRGNLVEKRGHFFVAAEEVVEDLSRPQLLDVRRVVYERVEEAYVRGDLVLGLGVVGTHLVRDQVHEFGPRRVVHQ